MDTQTTEQQAASPQRDTALLSVAVAALLGGMFAFYYFETQYNALIRVLMLLGGLLVALGVAYQTAAGRSLWGYVVGSRIELRKVVWPTRQESVQATLMIAVVVLIMALLLWGLDLHLHQHVAGEELALGAAFDAVLDLHDLFGRDQDLTELFLQAGTRDTLAQGLHHAVLVLGVRVHHIPAHGHAVRLPVR